MYCFVKIMVTTKYSGIKLVPTETAGSWFQSIQQENWFQQIQPEKQNDKELVPTNKARN